MRGCVVVGAVFPPQLLPSHLMRCTRFSCSAILLLVLSIISVFPRCHPFSVTCRTSANPNRQTKQATRIERETTKKREYTRKPGPKTDCIQLSTEVSSTHIQSRLQSVLIVIRPGVKRLCSQSCVLRAVTATCDCGRVTAIVYSRLATRLRSLAIILPIHLFTITRVHVCNRIP